MFDVEEFALEPYLEFSSASHCRQLKTVGQTFITTMLMVHGVYEALLHHTNCSIIKIIKANI